MRIFWHLETIALMTQGWHDTWVWDIEQATSASLSKAVKKKNIQIENWRFDSLLLVRGETSSRFKPEEPKSDDIYRVRMTRSDW